MNISKNHIENRNNPTFPKTASNSTNIVQMRLISLKGTNARAKKFLEITDKNTI